MFSPKIVLLCSLLVVVLFFEEGDAWGFRAPRIRVPRIRLPRIRVPRIRVPRIRLPRIRLPRLSSVIPRIRLPCYIRPRISFSAAVPYIRSMDGGLYSIANDTVGTGETCTAIVTRSEWNAASLKESPELKLPLKVIALYVRGDNCNTKKSCTAEAQKLYTESTSYNFMIGGDGTVFEGRGWYNVSGEKGNSVFTEYGICFIGKATSETMFSSFLALVDCGKSLGAISDSLTDDDFVERP